MFPYVVVGAVLLVYVAYQCSTPERRRRWLARINSPSQPALDGGDPTPPIILDADAGAHNDHHHDHGSDHGGHSGADFDIGGGGGHHH